jgi:hypothetical protein
MEPLDGKICLRATHSLFLNDPNEYIYATNLLLESMRIYEANNNLLEQKSTRFNSDFMIKLPQVSGMPFLVSFSEHGDDLNMWRNYGSNGTGVAIGFDLKKINEYSCNPANTNTKLYKCDYSKEKALTKLVDEFWAENYNNIDFNSNSIGINDFKLLFYLFEGSFLLKRQEYQTEMEWRLCKNELNNSNIKFRTTKQIIVPFIEHYFTKDFITEIKIGPCVNHELIEHSIKIMLKSYQYNEEKILIDVSPLSYRNF